MFNTHRTWQEELEIIDRTMKAISGVTDPEELIEIYWNGIGELISIEDYVALSRRGVEPPEYLITRSSRFTEHFNPWLEREKLPRLTGGLLCEIAYGNKPVIIEDLPARLSADDPAWFYLEGFRSLVALPQYDDGEGLNVTVMLFPAGAEWNPAIIPMLHWQGGLFGRGTQNLVLRNQLGEALLSLDREMQAVGNIQRSLLPDRMPEIPGFEMAADYETSSRAGGDYYDYFPLDNGEWGLFIADVSGHGTPAAVLMAITHAVAHAQPGTHTPPGALLEYLNAQLADAYTRDGTFVTAFYAVLNPRDRTLTYARAGHNPPRLVRGDRVLSLDEVGGLPLGLVPGQSYELARVPLEPGDLVLLYTDGIIEATSPPGSAEELFGVGRLDAVLVECRDCGAEGCLEKVCAALTAFTGNASPPDDQTLFALRVL